MYVIFFLTNMTDEFLLLFVQFSLWIFSDQTKIMSQNHVAEQSGSSEQHWNRTIHRETPGIIEIIS